ncbi:quinon protein alcohol dehydrogenase-like superfamily [Fusarium flagelliforme]|uniref:quinon protein alcohol dehydrogenase-like superfamily n=1 Tax=Fusarium flagelliforme TaxID=2675880 RepID=UPI001E8E1EB6|nr:quinon protein alcohol dehydrogenase-like superfamily [Fusarium flagelliforme]KAH7174198.1 quinon protein alcohol dehydrogenase-like superfamily [Fusarium flagelliforme]
MEENQDKQGKCLPGTQRNALNTIQTWAESPDGEPIFWLAGMAGTGKSTIAITVANCLHDKHQFFSREQVLDDRTVLGATFFLSHEDPDRNTVKYVFPTIARTLAERFPDIGEYISQSIYRDTTVGTARLVQQMQSLVSEPLAIFTKTLLVGVRLILIIDSVDECEDSSEAVQFLRLLPSLGMFHPIEVRVLVVSRPEKHISQVLDDPDLRVKKLVLEKIPFHVDFPDPDDITRFLRHELDSITKRREFSHDWIKCEEMSQLIERAGGLFIYAATTCRFLDMTDDDEIQGLRLGKLIEGKTDHGTPEARLDEIYRKVLAFPTRNMSKDERDVVFKSLLKREGIRKTLMDFRSILEVPPDDESAVSFFHMSFRDFLLTKERSGVDLFVDLAQVHRDLFLNCVAILNESLHQDICGLAHPGTFASQIPKARVHEYIPQHIRYSCLYWFDHLSKLSNLQPVLEFLDDDGEVYEFLSTKFLYWLEVLSLLGEYHRSIPTIKHLQLLAKADKSPALSSFLHDAYRFFLSNNKTISQAPLQAYCSALIFSPVKSIIRATFLSLIPSWITRYSDWTDEWGTELMTFNGIWGGFDISRDGKVLVTADFEGSTRVWSVTTGLEMARFQHPSRAINFAICRDNTTIASVHRDLTISLRSLSNEFETILTGNTKPQSQIVASPTGDVLASISEDYMITLWDMETTKIIDQIVFDEGESIFGQRLIFSPCGQVLIAGCGEATRGGVFVWNWKAQTRRKIKKHHSRVRAIAVSPNGEYFASSDEKGSLQVWTKMTEATKSETEIEGCVLSIAWHPDKLWMLALGIDNSSIQLCNIASARVQMIKRIDVPGTVTIPMEGLAFAGSLPILASANYMGCLRLWDTDVASPDLAKKTRIHSLHFPAGNNTMVLVVSEDCAELLNLQTGARQIFLTDTRAVAFSPAQDLVAFCFKNDTIQFWDGTLTRLIKTFSEFSDVFFPKCGTLIVLMFNNKALLLEYHTLNSQCLIELPREWVPRAGPILTSKGISIVTKGDEKESNKIWLFRCDTGELVPGFPHVIALERGWTSVRDEDVFMSPNGQHMFYLTTGKNNQSSFVTLNLEADYEKAILALGQDKPFTSPAFSPTGNRMILGTDLGNIFIWDLNTMALVKKLAPCTSPISRVHYCTGERTTVTTWTDGGNESQLWDVEKGQLVQKWKADGSIDQSFEKLGADRQHFTLNGGWLLSPTGDNTASCSTLTDRDTCRLDIEGGWVWQGNDRLLCLPSEFNPDGDFTSFGYVSWPVKAFYQGILRLVGFILRNSLLLGKL